MIGQTSGAEVAACVFLAVGLFAGSLVPFFLLVEADFAAVGESLGAAAGAVGRPSREAARDVAALFLLLTTRPTGAMA